MSAAAIRWVFLIAGIYDFAIGMVFLCWGPQLFTWANVPHPNHWAYIQFGSLLLLIFGVMFLTIASAPRTHRNLIPFGILLKVAYIGIVGYYSFSDQVPLLFQPFALIDAVMFVLFILAYQALSAPRSGTP